MGQTSILGNKSCKFRLVFRFFAERYALANNNPIYLVFKTGIPVTQFNNVYYLEISDNNLLRINGSSNWSSFYTYFDIEINDGEIVDYEVVSPLTFSNVSALDISDFGTYGRVCLEIQNLLRDYGSNRLSYENELFSYIGKDCCFKIGENVIINLFGGKKSNGSDYLDSDYMPRLLIGGQDLFNLSFDYNEEQILDIYDITVNTIYNCTTVYNSFTFDSLELISKNGSTDSSEIQVLSDINNSLKELTNEVIEVGKAVSSFNVDIDVINNDKEKSLVNTVFPYKNFNH